MKKRKRLMAVILSFVVLFTYTMNHGYFIQAEDTIEIHFNYYEIYDEYEGEYNIYSTPFDSIISTYNNSDEYIEIIGPSSSYSDYQLNTEATIEIYYVVENMEDQQVEFSDDDITQVGDTYRISMSAILDSIDNPEEGYFRIGLNCYEDGNQNGIADYNDDTIYITYKNYEQVEETIPPMSSSCAGVPGARIKEEDIPELIPLDHYEFIGWSPELPERYPETAQTYTAQFALEQFQIQFLDGDGNVLQSNQFEYGSNLAELEYENNTPTKTSTAQYNYIFTGWDKEWKNVEVVEEDINIQAQFEQSLRQYTVQFRNGDDILYHQVVNYEEGATYHGLTPTKESDIQYDYEFVGWDKDFDTITGDTVINAQFNAIPKEYTVTFKDDNGSVLEQVSVPYGQAAVFGGAVPTKADQNGKRYVFSGWSEDITVITKNTVVLAQFVEEDIQTETPQPATPQPATPQPATPQPATPQPATPQPATPQPATPQPATSLPTSEDKPTVTPTPVIPVEPVTVKGGKYFLQTGTPYRLEKGEWVIVGESTIYEGSNVFYVKTSGSYEFQKKE